MAGGISYTKKKIVLNYRDEKPQVWKLQQLTYPVVKEKDLIRYIANAGAVPESTVAACVEAIVYFAINGMRVVIPDFGGFYVKVQTKTVKTKEAMEEATADDLITGSTLSYVPVTGLRELVTEAEVKVRSNEIYADDFDPNA